ncbi:MAG: hypothetical protein JSV39_00355, partial [Candidatus Aenigmatarchaeota archaeon]
DISSWNENEWHHFAGIWGNLFGSGNIVSMFLDGSNDSVFNRNEFYYNGSFGEDMYIGSDADEENQSGSVFDELRISGVPRTPGEINASYLKFAGNHSL